LLQNGVAHPYRLGHFWTLGCSEAR
jgi:hypothetical protein